MGTAHSKSPFVPWETDSCRSSCSECSSLFSLFNRRHHCRSCGRLVCLQCSPYTEYLWHLGLGNETAFRICSSCALKSVNVTTLERAAYASSWKVSSLTDSEPDIRFLLQTANLIQDCRQCPAFNHYLLRHLVLSFRKCIRRLMSNNISISVRHTLQELLQESYIKNEDLETELDQADASHADLAPLSKSESISIPNEHPAKTKESKKHVQFSLEENA